MTAAILGAAEPPSGDFASFDVPLWLWGALIGAIVVMLVVDLLLVHRTAHAISIKEAAIESAVWISLGLAFGLVLLVWQGNQAGAEYYAGFLIEKSLSIDNVFVWAVIFSFFSVPREFQFRVLFWGIFGALVLRGIFIFAGVSLIERFEWILYVFGAFLLYTAWKIAHHDETQQVDYNANIAMRVVRRIVPTTPRYDGQKLFTRENGRRLATPLFAVLVLIEATDVVFAVDSVPAILAVSREPFIVFASNAFAILGLRSLYFLLGGMQGRFRYLNVGLGVILAFVGVKMLLIGEPFELHLPTYVSLTVIAVVITASIVASLRVEARDGGHTEEELVTAPERSAHARVGIVVGVDGSDGAAAALRWAHQEAQLRQRDLTAVLAWGYLDQHHPDGGREFSPDFDEAEAEAALDTAVEAALGDAAGTVRRASICDLPARALIEASASADLLVVGARGLGGVTGLLLGSVSQHCLRHATCPVAVVPHDAASRPVANRVVVGVDGSPASLEALGWAAEEARVRDAELAVVHAWHLPNVGGRHIDPEALRQTATETLDQALAEADLPADVHIASRVVNEQPGQALVGAAADADLTVVGARGLGRVTGALLGSVSQHVAQHAPGPVIVVRASTAGSGDAEG